MQEWLKDKKNLPIVAAVGALVLIGSIVLILFENGAFAPHPAPTPVASSSGPGVTPPGVMPGLPGGLPPQTMPAGGPPGTPPAGARPGQTPARPGQTPVAAGAKAPAALLNVAKGPDPFKVPGYHPFHLSQASVNALRVRNSLPPVFIQQYTPKDQLITKARRGNQSLLPVTLTPEVSSSMRMSGVITSDNSIKALLEANGVSTQVQPGDTVNGGKVLSIQADGLTLRTSDNRLVRVPLSSTPTGGNSPYGGGNSPYGGGNSPYGGSGGGYMGNNAPGDNPNAPQQQ